MNPTSTNVLIDDTTDDIFFFLNQYFYITAGCAIDPYKKRIGKSGQQRATYLTNSEGPGKKGTESATENNCHSARNDEGENAG